MQKARKCCSNKSFSSFKLRKAIEYTANHSKCELKMNNIPWRGAGRIKVNTYKDLGIYDHAGFEP